MGLTRFVEKKMPIYLTLSNTELIDEIKLKSYETVPYKLFTLTYRAHISSKIL